jgi:hypothetical protein
MSKQTTNSGSEAVSRSGDGWLDLVERLAQVEITSENADHPLTKKSRITALISRNISLELEIVPDMDAVPTRRWRRSVWHSGDQFILNRR